ncbi:MAG TPA: DNA repair protein RadC [Allosphingosinicella sp.]
MDERALRLGGAWASGALAGARRHPVGLRGDLVDLELSNPRNHHVRNLESSEAPGEVRCRQILVELLRPLGPAAADWADRLVSQFGSLAATLAAAPAAQARALGDGAAAVRHLGIVRDAMLHSLRTEAFARPTLDDSQKLIDYLSLDMALLPTERLRVLFLNSSNRLLHDETHTHGSVSETPVYPREIMRRALEVGATALILAHNHPSGDPTPSRGDVEATRRIAEAGRALDICIHDHVIVARSGWSSFRALGLLQPARRN